MILSSFFASLGQMGDRRFRSVLWRGIGLTIALLVGAYAGLLWLIEGLTTEPLVLPWGTEITWIGDLLGWGSLALMLVASVLLMVPVASAITSLFLDEVARAVEDVHYPHVPEPAPVGFWDGLRDSVNFLGVLVAVNLLAIILYIAFAPAAPFIFIAVNGFLLGREYFTVAAMRHLGRAGARALRREHGALIWLAGCLMAAPLMIPVLNLFVPILGAATFTHIYHRLRA